MDDGKIGAEAVRGIVAHPDLQLVGADAFSPDKVGETLLELGYDWDAPLR